MYLTGKEIKDLAEYVGLVIDKDSVDEDCFEQEFFIDACPKSGVQNDGGVVEHYSHIVTCDGCDGNECMPLGDALDI